MTLKPLGGPYLKKKKSLAYPGSFSKDLIVSCSEIYGGLDLFPLLAIGNMSHVAKRPLFYLNSLMASVASSQWSLVTAFYFPPKRRLPWFEVLVPKECAGISSQVLSGTEIISWSIQCCSLTHFWQGAIKNAVSPTAPSEMTYVALC